MKTHLPLAAALMIALSGCDQKNSSVEDLQRKNAELQAKLEEQERVAKLKAAEDLAAQQMAANDEAARKLAADRAALAAQMAQLTATQKAAEAERFQIRQQALKAEEQRIADARAQSARQAEEARERARVRDVKSSADRRTLDLFYDQLDPSGDWLEVEGYGYVFRPTAAGDRHWRPYMDGAWLRSDQGWVWKSNEPFGWATYHYGRWIRLNKRGWVWVPGSEWAPAWVAWRANEDYIGWAPLPPEAYSPNGFNFAVDDYYDIGASSYVFVTRRNFTGGKTYAGRFVDPDRNGRIVAETENVTNISYQQVNRQTVIVNEGPSLASVSDPGAAPVTTFKVHRIEAGNPHEHPTATASGVLSIFAPALLHQLQTKPSKVTSRETYEVNRGWKEMPAEMQARIRERNANEARRLEARQRSGAITPPPPAAPPPSAPPEIRRGAPKPGAAPSEPGGLRQRAPAPGAVSTPQQPMIAPAQNQKPADVPPAPAPAPPPAPAAKPEVVTPAPITRPERKKPEVAPPAPVVAPEPKPSVAPPVPAPPPNLPAAPPADVPKLERKPAVIVPVPMPANPSAPAIIAEPKPVVIPPAPVPVSIAPPAPVIKPDPKPEIVRPPLIIKPEPPPVALPPVPAPAPITPPPPVIKKEIKPEIVPPAPPVVPPAPAPANIPEPKPAVIPPLPPTPPPLPGEPGKPGAP